MMVTLSMLFSIVRFYLMPSFLALMRLAIESLVTQV